MSASLSRVNLPSPPKLRGISKYAPKSWLVEYKTFKNTEFQNLLLDNDLDFMLNNFFYI